MSERKVVYILSAVADPDNKSAFEAMAAGHKSLLEAIKNNDSVINRLQKEQTERQKREGQKATETARQSEEAKTRKAAEEARKRADNEIRAHESAVAKIKSGNAMMADSLNGVLEGTRKVVTGFAVLGIVGEKDLQKVIDQFGPLIAGLEMVSGGVKIYMSLTKAVEGYRTAVAAATAAESAAAAVRATAAAGGAGAAVAGASGIGAAGAGAGIIGAISGPALAAAAALAAVAVAGKMLHEQMTGNNGPGSVSDTVGGWIASGENASRRFFKDSPEGGDYIDARIAAEDALKAGEVQKEQIAREKAFLESGRTALGAVLGNQRDQESNAYERSKSLMPRKDEEKLDAISAMIEQQRALRASLSKTELQGDLADERESAGRGIVASLQREQELVKDREDAERRILDVKRHAVDVAIAGGEKELQSIRDQIAARQDALKSVRERFADLDPEERKQWKNVADKIRDEGAESLTRDERRIADRFNTDFGREARSASAEAEAKRLEGAGGYKIEDLFASSDVRKLDELNLRKGEIELAVGFNVDLKSTLEADAEKIADSAYKSIAPLLKDQYDRIDQLLAAKFKENDETFRSMKQDIVRIENRRAGNTAIAGRGN